MNDIKEVLILAAKALEIAADHGIGDVQINSPPEWNLKAYEENEGEGWCAASELAAKIRDLVMDLDEGFIS